MDVYFVFFPDVYFDTGRTNLALSFPCFIYVNDILIFLVLLFYLCGVNDVLVLLLLLLCFYSINDVLIFLVLLICFCISVQLADVWSCGVTLYVMLVGAYPFEDQEDPKIFRKTINVIFWLFKTIILM